MDSMLILFQVYRIIFRFNLLFAVFSLKPTDYKMSGCHVLKMIHKKNAEASLIK